MDSYPQVVEIREQPCSVWYAWNTDSQGLQIDLLDAIPKRRTKNTQLSGVSHIVPDFLVQMLNGPARLVEVKPSHRLDRPVVQRKLAVARRLAHNEGWTFHVVTEKQLLSGPLLENVRLINRYRQANLSQDDLNRVVQQVPPDGIEFSALFHDPDSIGLVR
ncbi:MAG: Tn7 transposase TnsA N-terminal domain-containing protein, partial [Planctomycetes bacterium]|nr:Tn7 transposase TnsA N-terminal domain-containing protein [Planctomycetota bacterium]